MERYDKYKDSGFDWIGEIPEHWEVKKLKYLTLIGNGKDHKKVWDNNGEYTIIGTGGKFGNANTFLYDKPSIILGRKGTIDKPQFIEVPLGAVDTAYYTIIKETTFPKYLFYLSKTINFGLYKYGSAVPSMNQEVLKEIYFAVPDKPEQTSIANYLDCKTAEINELINQKEQLLKLYEEEKTAIINQAVTKGLNPDVKLKDSGIDWLGEIPEHWEVKKLKYVSKIQGRIGFKGYRSADLVNNEEGAITLGASHISKKNKIDLSNPIYLNWKKYYESPEIMVKKNDIVFTQRGAYLGKVGFIDKDYGEVTINPSLILLKNIKINSEFLSYFLTSNFIRENVSVISSDTAIPMISQHQTANFYCVFPPKEEQTAIVQHIEKETTRINTKAKKTKKLIELLGEYKQSLISEVVTGKIKVI